MARLKNDPLVVKEADNQRREEFKKYEMEKKFEKEHRLNAINDTQVL